MTIETLTEAERAFIASLPEHLGGIQLRRALRVIDSQDEILSACYEWACGPSDADPPQELADWHSSRHVWDAVNREWRRRP